VVYGLALETKHNAWYLPAALVPHAALVCARSWLRRPGEARRVVWPWGLLAMATIGPAVFYALWPYIWNDTRPRLEWYVNFHVNHEYYNIEFLGKNYFGPPSPTGYLPFLVVATVPAVTILLFFVGAFDRLAAGLVRVRLWLGAQGLAPEAIDPQETDILIALVMGVAMGPFFLPKTPIFGGTKHWMPAYPMMALFAGKGFQVVVASMRRALPGLEGRHFALAVAGLVASVVLGPLAITAHAGSFGLAAYVPLVGGTAGGADLGLNRGFWGYTTLDAAREYLDPQAPRGASVFISDTTWDAWARMQEDEGIRRDLRAAGTPSDGQLSLVQHELHMNEVDYSIWEAYRTTSPVYVVTHDGVPMVSIYKR
jgi:hypothetical protein